DRSVLAVRARPGWGPFLLDPHLKALGLLAPVAVTDPDEVFAGARDFDCFRNNRTIVCSTCGHRQEAALTTLIPRARPPGTGESPVPVGLPDRLRSHRPAVSTNPVEMLRLDPQRFVRRHGRRDYQNQDERQQAARDAGWTIRGSYWWKYHAPFPKC